MKSKTKRITVRLGDGLREAAYELGEEDVSFGVLNALKMAKSKAEEKKEKPKRIQPPSPIRLRKFKKS